MLNAAEVLRAHARCKARLTGILSNRTYRAPNFCELTPHPDCVLIRFVRENQGNRELEPELRIIESAHAAVHNVVIGIARKCAAGQRVDIDAEFSPSGNLGAASSSLVNAIRRFERKLHSKAS